MEVHVDQQVLELIVKNIVNNPESVKVERKVDEMGVLLTLKVDPNDMAQVIGRQGAMAQALRTILRVVGLKNKARINLKIEEPGGVPPSRDVERVADQIAEDFKI